MSVIVPLGNCWNCGAALWDGGEDDGLCTDCWLASSYDDEEDCPDDEEDD